MQGLLTTKELAAKLGKSEATIWQVTRLINLPAGSVIRQGVRNYFMPEVVELFRAYFLPPQGWLTIEQLTQQAPDYQRNNLNYWLQQIPEHKKYFKKCSGNVFYYDPALVDLLAELKPKKKYLKLIKQPPEGVEWLKLIDFCALFGKGRSSGLRWFNMVIPPEFSKKIAGKVWIRSDAVKFIDGKVRDVVCRKNEESDRGEVDYSSLILLDGYLLTEDQHRRRLEIKARAFAGLKFDK